MPFLPQLDSGQLDQLRSNSGYSIDAYLALMPNPVLFQCQPLDDQINNVYAEIEYTNTTGDFNDVKAGMTFIVSYQGNINVPAYRGRIRRDANDTRLFIEETDFVLSTLATIYVIDDYDYWTKIPRISGGTYFKDWNITFRRLLPRISGLQSSYVRVADTSASFTFNPIGHAMEFGSTISSWQWQVGDGSITVGTSTSQNITVSFPEGSRWVKVTVTDSGARNFTFIFAVHVIPTDYSSVVKLDVEQLRITATIEDGWNASVNAFDGFRSVLDRTHATLFVVEHYADASPFANNIAFVGRMRQTQSTTRGDDIFSQVQEAAITLEGPLALIARLRAVTLSIRTVLSNATAWDEIRNATPGRTMWYLLTEHSTVANLHSINFIGDSIDASDDDDLNYISPDLGLPDTSLLDSLAYVANQYNAQPVFAAAGELLVFRNYNYLTEFNKQESDIGGGIRVEDTETFSIDRDPDDNLGRVNVGAGSFTTAVQETTVIIATAPGQGLGRGQEVSELNGQILQSNIPLGTAREQAGLRAASLFGDSQPRDIINATMWLKWWFLQPSVHQKWQWVIDADSNIRGIRYESGFPNNFWLLRAVDLGFDANTGQVVVSGEWQIQATVGLSGVETAIVPGNVDFTLPVMPPLPPYTFFPTPPTVNYPTDSPGLGDLQPYTGNDASYFEPIPTPDVDGNAPADPNCWTGNVFINTLSNIVTPFATILGETYIVVAEGVGVMNFSDTLTWDFSENNGGFVASRGVYVPGSYWDSDDAFQASIMRFTRQFIIQRDFGRSIPITQITMTPDFILGDYDAVGNALEIQAPNATARLTIASNVISSPLTATQTFNGSISASSITFVLRSSRQETAVYSGRARVTEASINTDLGATNVDAFYQDINTTPQVLPTNQGLVINNVSPTPIPLYSSNNRYVFTITGTGAQLSLKYVTDFPELNSNNFIRVTICGPGVT